MARRNQAKYRVIYEHVRKDILAGNYGVGDRIPTEMELASQFDASRVTVSRALRDLEQQGLLQRRRGAGSFVRRRESARDSLLGLITGETPGVLTIICDEIARFAHESQYGILLGKWPIANPEEIVRHTENLSRQCIARKVAGVFFTPMHIPADQMPVNVHVAEAFDRAGIPVVLVDRDIVDYPQRSKFDLVGLDNVQAGFVLTEHLLKLGHRKIDFVASGSVASSVTARIAGYREALLQQGITPDPCRIHRGETSEADFVRHIVEYSCPEAIVCANDLEAAKMMRELTAVGKRVPEEVALVGVNDDPYAALLNVPLTTLRQPCSDIGSAAAKLMLQRLQHRDRLPQEVRLNGELVVRESCGAVIRSSAAAAVKG